jgi:Tfp pilus assembly protein PilZ
VLEHEPLGKQFLMEKRFDVPRTIRRVSPKHAATVAVSTDSQQPVYGILTNVSVTGTCIVTDSRLAPGSEVDLKISFYQQPRVYEIAARVVWSRRAGTREKSFEGLPLHGLQFTRSSALQKLRFHALLASKDFVDVFRPSETEFSLFLNALAVDLDELGSKI